MEHTAHVQTARSIAKWDAAHDAWIPSQEKVTLPIFERLDVFSETFPTSGMTLNGVAYELPTWEPHTQDSGSSSSQGGALLPTVTVSDTNGPGRHGTGGLDLRTSVSLLPTPTTQDGANNGGPSQFERNTPPLNTRVLMLPTPQAHDAQKGKTAEQVAAMRARGHGVSNLNELAENELSLLQTPSVADALGGHERRGGKRSAELLLNGQVKALHGATTNQPSAAGNESLEGELPGQLSLLDAMADTA